MEESSQPIHGQGQWTKREIEAALHSLGRGRRVTEDHCGQDKADSISSNRVGRFRGVLKEKEEEGGVMLTYIVIGCPTEAAGLALYTLPGVFLHGYYHVGGKLQAGWMPWSKERTGGD